MRNIHAISALALAFGATSCIQENTGSLFSSFSKDIIRDSQQGTASPGTMTSSGACVRGPTLVSLSEVSATSLIASFDGSGVTEILFEIFNSRGVLVASSKIIPSGSSFAVNYGALPGGNYTLVFKGVNCSGQSQLPFTVATVVNPTPTPTPTLADCARGPSLISVLTNVKNTSLTAQFDGDGILELSWAIMNSANGTVAGATFVPSASIFSVNYSELAPGTYSFVIRPTKCKAKAGSVLSREFTIAVVTPTPTPTATPTPTPTATPTSTPTPNPSNGMAAALIEIRSLAASSSCTGCHNGFVSIAFAHATDSIMLANLATVVKGKDATTTQLYIRSQRGQTHATYPSIPTGTSTAWRNAIQAYITALTTTPPTDPGTGGGGTTVTGAGASHFIHLKDRFSMASIFRDRFTRDNYSAGNSSNGAGVALEHLYNLSAPFGGRCLTYNLGEMGQNQTSKNVGGKGNVAGGENRNYVCGDGWFYNKITNEAGGLAETSTSVFREIARTKSCDYLFGVKDYTGAYYKASGDDPNGLSILDLFYRHNPDDAVRMALEPIGVSPEQEPNPGKMQQTWQIFHVGESIGDEEKNALYRVGTTAKQKGYSNFEAWRFMLLTTCLSPMWQVK